MGLRPSPTDGAPRRRSRSAVLVLAAVTAATPLLAAVPASADTLTAFDAVDPFIGTELDTTENKSNDAYGNTFPGATVPFGLVQSSPTTFREGGNGEKGGYEYTGTQLRGFGLTRMSGTGCTGNYSGFDVPILPFTGDLVDGALPTDPGATIRDYYLDFSHDDEIAQPGYYSVETANGVVTELTSTERTAVSRFDFPEGTDATLLLDVAGSNNAISASAVSIDAATSTVEGSVTAAGLCGSAPYTLHFSATFDAPFASHGVWDDGAVTAGGDEASGTSAKHGTGAFLTFADGAEVTARIGISYVDVDGAELNRTTEVGDTSFDDVRAGARAAWEDALARIEVGGGTDEQRIKLYTALYHALHHPNAFNDVDGRYIGADKQIHEVEEGRTLYTNYAGWDFYRSSAQLIAMLYPEVASDINHSILTLTQQNGGRWVDGWAQHNPQTRMAADSLPTAVSSIDAFGSTDYDREAALASLTSSQTLPGTRSSRPDAQQYFATGVVENRKGNFATARVLEYSITDFAIAQLAERLGDDAASERYMVGAQSWLNVFDDQTQHIRPRERTGFDRGFDLRGRDGTGGGQFNQATGYQYGWLVPHNMGSLVDRRGGLEAATRALDEHTVDLDAGAYTQVGAYLSNQPSLNMPWSYHWLQAPHRTTDVLHRATDLWDTTPAGIPGNDDLGGLSAWYVWSNLGIYPGIYGTANLLVSAPHFEQITIRSADSDRVYEINAPGQNETVRYTTALKVDGVEHTSSWVGEDFAREGGTLDFTLAATPGAWGTTAADVPPSYTDGMNDRNNVGTTPNGRGNMGSLDYSDWSFSRETLAQRGAAPGAQLPLGDTGITFTWPETAVGEPDNWIVNGQRIEVDAPGAATVSILGLATNGPSKGTAYAEYSDGTRQAIAVELTDWAGQPGGGNSTVVQLEGRNNVNGTSAGGTFRVFATRPAPLDASKDLVAVHLPRVTDKGVMHVFDVAASTTPFVDPNAPTGAPDRIILTVPEDPSTSQYVTWRSTSSLPIDGKVEVRTVDEAGVPQGAVVTVDAEEKPERTLNGYPSRSHSAKLVDLEPGTTYTYRVGAGAAWSEWSEFTTATAEADPFTFLYFGDAQEGIDTVWHDSVDAAWAAAPDARLSIYAGDMTNTSTIEKEWDDWLGGIGEKARTTNAVPTPGNHEVGPEPFMEHYLDTFEHDDNGPVAADAGRFAGTYGAHLARVLKDTVYFSDFQGVRFVTLNANRDDICPISRPAGLASFSCDTARTAWMTMQATWLDRVLQENPHEWSVVTAHQPVYSTGVSGNGLRDEANWRSHILPVLETNNVDLVLQGHDHTYGRGYSSSTATGMDGVTAGPVFVVSNAGQKHYTLPSATDNIWTRNNATAVVRAQDTATFQKITVDGDTLEYTSVVTQNRPGGSASVAVGEELDSFTITKREDGAKWVTEAGVAVPGPEVAPVNVDQPFNGSFDDATFGEVIFDDDFSTDRLAEYTTFAGPGEPQAALSVDTGAGVLNAVADGRRWSNLQVPVEAGDSFAIVVEPEHFAGVASGEDTFFLGAAAGANDRAQSWYHDPGGSSGFEKFSGGTRRGLAEGPARCPSAGRRATGSPPSSTPARCRRGSRRTASGARSPPASPVCGSIRPTWPGGSPRSASAWTRARSRSTA
ncbi:alpha-mannosidase [Serinibacter arcticus]|uniref:Alpha-mannosidase n=1 Tax=Serinibacter arcticus TaxID=1655435 RepID=A0A2U1ZWU5_9MICO|nr:GH92 family glycosyl hydrolase [Serinibacter arcticus]PWD51455.1 alpha-mannosidase [Serinibacter arcticus]